ncbi:pentatricopeptide repeat-containing protein At5g16640, mitochondrial-like [Arachis ipaensis]|uniref:pentatricopeptide repeat-containing protein At5g16640, mitochondrial-like n=1 Tax=Arachis ipaensis TaxID=130454 RepID=UPI0007AF3826|nr:pentatricopeptide repeat-containing protein At5g16640, mitochondrial-like [Arachis ipaensis]
MEPRWSETLGTASKLPVTGGRLRASIFGGVSMGRAAVCGVAVSAEEMEEGRARVSPLPSRDAYKFDNVEDVVALFNCMVDMHPQPLIVELTKILGTVVKMKYYATAIYLYTQMESKGILPFSVTLNVLINCYGHAGQMGFALSVMSKFVKWGFKPSVVTFTTIMKGLCLNGKILDALDIYDKIVAKGFWFDEVIYGTLINGLYGLLDDALDLYFNMLDRGISPDVVTYTSLIYGFCHVGQWKEARLLLNEIVVKDIGLDVYTFNIIIDALCKEKMLLQAHILCDVMILRVDEAKNLFYMVIERGVVPDVWSYNILIKGYCKINKVDEAKNLMKDMFRKNIVPNIVTYNSLVDGLCKAGRISSVREIVNKMHYCGQPFSDVNTYNILMMQFHYLKVSSLKEVCSKCLELQYLD